MSRRTRQRVETGFQSLRDLAICCLGAYGFWFQVTRVPDPEVTVLVFCGVLMAAPGVLTFWRAVVGGTTRDDEELRALIREELDRSAKR